MQHFLKGENKKDTQEELLKMPASELRLEREKCTLELVKARLAIASRQEKNTSKLKKLRRYIASIETITSKL